MNSTTKSTVRISWREVRNEAGSTWKRQSCWKSDALQKTLVQHRQNSVATGSCRHSWLKNYHFLQEKARRDSFFFSQIEQALSLADSSRAYAPRANFSAFMSGAGMVGRGWMVWIYNSNCKGNSWLSLLWLPGVHLMPHVHFCAFYK